MSETIPPPPEVSKGNETSKSRFEPSFVAPDQKTILNIKDSTLRRRIHLLHNAAVNEPASLSADLLDQEAKELRDGIASKKYKSEQISGVAARLQKQANEMRNPPETKKAVGEMLDTAHPAIAEALKTAGTALLGAGVAETVDAAQNLFGKKERGDRFRLKEDDIDRKIAEAVKKANQERNAAGGGTETPNSSQKETKEKKYSEMTYSELLRIRENSNLSADQRSQIEEEMSGLVSKFYDYRIDNDRLVERFIDKAFETVKYNPWDKVYNALIKDGEEQERFLRQSSGDDPRFEGIARTTFRAEAARVKLSGIQDKMRQNPNGYTQEWRVRNNATDEEIARFQEQVKDGIFRLLPKYAAPLVGSELAETDSTYKQAGGPVSQSEREKAMKDAIDMEEYQRLARRLDSGQEDRYVPIQAPDHVGAVFKGGLFEKMFRHPTIPILEIRKQGDREIFVLENIHAFDYIFNSPGQWLGALDSWIKDAYFSARQAIEADQSKPDGFKDADRETLIKELKAAMSVTASARAMEKSNGSLEAYGVWLTTGGQGKEADLDVQDQLKDKILHEDGEEKRKLILQNAKVKLYYDKLTKDMGVIGRDEKTAMLQYEVGFIRNARAKRNDVNSVVYYLSDQASTKQEKDANGNPVRDATGKIIEHQGGFTGYMEDVLLKGIDKNSKNWDVEWAAARLATDLVLTDGTFTRWEWDITGGKAGETVLARNMAAKAQYDYYNTRGLSDAQKQNLANEYDFWNRETQMEGGNRLMLFPILNWGGDPLRSILEPTFLPRKIKSAYRDNPVGQEALDDLDSAFAPYDIYYSANLDAKQRQKNILTRERHQLKVSMTENWKRMARWSRPEFTAMGGSQAETLGDWSKDTAANMLAQMYLMNQVVGGTTETHRNKEVYPEGKHELGANIARTLKAKAKAYVSQRPGIIAGDLQAILLDPRGHPNYEALSILLGPDLTGKTGLIRQMNSSSTGPIFRGNWFGAAEDIDTTIRILMTNNPHA